MLIGKITVSQRFLDTRKMERILTEKFTENAEDDE